MTKRQKDVLSVISFAMKPEAEEAIAAALAEIERLTEALAECENRPVRYQREVEAIIEVLPRTVQDEIARLKPEYSIISLDPVHEFIQKLQDEHENWMNEAFSLGDDNEKQRAEIDRLTAALADERRSVAEEIAVKFEKLAAAWRDYGMDDRSFVNAANTARQIGSAPPPKEARDGEIRG